MPAGDCHRAARLWPRPSRRCGFATVGAGGTWGTARFPLSPRLAGDSPLYEVPMGRCGASPAELKGRRPQGSPTWGHMGPHSSAISPPPSSHGHPGH